MIIGLSFAPTDFELRWLIRQSRLPPGGLQRAAHPIEIQVVNPDPEHRRAARELFGNDCVMTEFDTLDEYLLRVDEHPLDGDLATGSRGTGSVQNDSLMLSIVSSSR